MTGPDSHWLAPHGVYLPPTFDEALTNLGSIHCKEVARLRQQIIQLQGGFHEETCATAPYSFHDADESKVDAVVPIERSAPASTNFLPRLCEDGPQPSETSTNSRISEIIKSRHAIYSSGDAAESACASQITSRVRPSCKSSFERINHTQTLDEVINEMDKVSAKKNQADRLNQETLKYELRVTQARKVPKRHTMFDRFIESPYFDGACGAVIVFNSLLIGYNVNQAAISSDKEQTYVGHACSLFFLIELFLRVMSQRWAFFEPVNRSWNLFDAFLVILSIVDFLMVDIYSFSGARLSIMKMVKMARIIRVFRIFRFFHELGILVHMIFESMYSLIWAAVLLIIIIYVFAVIFTQSAADFLKEQLENDIGDQLGMQYEVSRRFGSLSHSTYTLYQTMLNGVSWGIVTDALLAIGWLPTALFAFYIAFTLLVVMNIITGVFVENAVETARAQREFFVQKEAELRERYIGEMCKHFAEMDEDESGAVSLEELIEYFTDPHMERYLQALGVQPNDLEQLFHLIDKDCSGEVTPTEFLDGCLQIKGQARSIDVLTMMADLKKLSKDLAANYSYQRNLASAPSSDKNSGHHVIKLSVADGMHEL